MSTSTLITLAGEPPASNPDASVRPRLDSVDLLRGLVMVFMVLDHTRDYFTNARFDPSDLTKTNLALFATRWVTHFCAPVFVFLAGTGAYLSRARGKSKAELAKFLVIRGVWLIVLEFTVARLAITFDPFSPVLLAIVLWAIGWSMIALAGLIFIPLPLVGAIGVAMIAAHNRFDTFELSTSSPLRGLWMVLRQQGLLSLPGGLKLFVAYPLIPWPGVMAVGYACGPLLLLEPRRRRRALFGLGLALTLGFEILRVLNVYGDPNPWTPQRSALFTFLSFLNTTKYPPSLLYLLMTLGPALMLLAFLDRPTGAFGRVLLTFGCVPLFFYLLQWPVAHGLAVLVAAVLHRPFGGAFAGAATPGSGFGLPVVYLMWLVVLGILYPLCRWFGDFKRRRRDSWLSYF